MTALTYAAPLCGGGEWWQFWKQMECGTGAGRPLASAATSLIADSVFQPWLVDAKKGVQDVLKTMITFWIDIPDPDVGTVNGQPNEVVAFLQDRLVWLGAVIMCFVVLYNCARIMWEENKAKPFKDVAKMVVVYLGTAALAIPGAATALLVTNYVAQTILELSTDNGTNFADNVFALFNNEAGVTSAILLIIIYIVAMIISGLMCLIMIGRGALFYVILGALLTQSATYATDSGKEGYMFMIGWLKGLLLFKIAAAAIYGVGFRFLSLNTGAENVGLLQMLYGLTLLLLGVFALPACMRITAPATAPVAGGSGPSGAITSAAPVLAAGMMRR
jgi:hypothetical protein